MLKISGAVKSGLGEGKIFLSMRQYKEQIIEKLGFEPFEGTLNILILDKDMEKLLKINGKVFVGGFKINGKEFGSACCIKAGLNGINGAVIMPQRTRHKDIVEFISPVNLREKLNLEDGDKVTVEVE